MWRKNRSVHKNNRCVGTDLNRNFASKHWCGKRCFMVRDAHEFTVIAGRCIWAGNNQMTDIGSECNVATVDQRLQTALTWPILNKEIGPVSFLFILGSPCTYRQCVWIISIFNAPSHSPRTALNMCFSRLSYHLLFSSLPLLFFLPLLVCWVQLVPPAWG